LNVLTYFSGNTGQ